MFHTRTAIACCTLAIVSTANAGFTFTATDQGLISGYQVYLIRAINDGIGTGTELDGYDLTFTMNPGCNAHFNVLDSDFDGTPDTADLVNTGNPNAGFMRVGAFGTTSIVSTTPVMGPTQPNPWNAISSWSVAAISTGSENATGNGAVIARLFLSGGASAGGSFTGQIGGNEGSAVPVTFSLAQPGDDFEPPTVFINPNSVTIDVNSQTSFGPIIVSATDNWLVDSLITGVVPAQIADNLSITGDFDGPLEMNGSGFTAEDVGTYTIDFTAMDASPFSADGHGTFTLNVVIPEPVTLGLLSGLTILVLRRR